MQQIFNSNKDLYLKDLTILKIKTPEVLIPGIPIKNIDKEDFDT